MKQKRILTSGIAILVVGISVLLYNKINFHFNAGALPLTSSANLHVVKVVDGDTLEVAQGIQKTTIRLIGIDTPEVVDPRKPVQCFGHEASNKAKATLQEGMQIKLENDPVVGNTDKYGRTLAYVFLPDGTNFNELMVKEGYAHEYTYHNVAYKYQALFKSDELNAREHNLGLWSAATCNGDTTQPAH